jgi:thiosulfate/3-mercaptopyruvate sulfurtransferase
VPEEREAAAGADGVLVTVEELAAALRSDRPPVVLDVRWRLGGPPGHEDYLTGHVPGAVFVPLDTELAGHGEPSEGRHPLPALADLQSAVRRWGVDQDDAVVVYDGGGNLAAARAWWLLRWAGLRDVRLLDGALPAWVEAGRPLEEDDVVPVPGRFVAGPPSLPTLTADRAGEWPRSGVLLDARAGERYRGEVEPVDPVAGHIPGALSAPTADNLGPDGRFRLPEELRATFAALGADGSVPVAVYCGSGVTAAHELVALALAGIDGTLYPGSWSQWSNQGRPVETGPPSTAPSAGGRPGLG